jgi:hypothetical protein
MVSIFLDLAVGLIDNLSFLLLTFAIYRLPIQYNIPRLMVSAAVLASVNYFQREILGYTEMYILINIVVGIILVKLLFQLPIAYAALIMATGYIVIVVVQMIVIVVPTLAGILTEEQVQSKYMILVSSTFVAAILYVIHKKKLGFMLIANRFSLNKGKLRPRDYFIAAIFISSVVLIQAAIVAFVNKTSLIFVLVALFALMLVGLVITYMINIKEIEERYFRRKR